MSLIDDDDTLKQVRRFFFERLMPPADQMRLDGRAWFPKGPDPDRATYFEKRSKIKMTKADFEFPSVSCMNDIESKLREQWGEQSIVGLSALAPDVAMLCELLRMLEKRQTSEVSPFIYTMF